MSVVTLMWENIWLESQEHSLQAILFFTTCVPLVGVE